MKKRQVILGLKSLSDFTYEERKMIIEEYLQTGCKKRDIWEKYTGQNEEKGCLLKWMRQLGYDKVNVAQQLTLCRIAESPDEGKAPSIGSGLFAIQCSATTVCEENLFSLFCVGGFVAFGCTIFL